MTAEQHRADTGVPRIHADERTTMVAFLDYLRDSLCAKFAGIDDEQARKPGVPSGTSLMWLVKHLTAVELQWFCWVYAGEDIERPEVFEPVADDDTVDGLLAAYREAVARCNEITLANADLDAPGARPNRAGNQAPSLRWVLVHMIEETARHAGHADILREQIDGAIGR